MLYIIKDTKEDKSVVQRQFIVAVSAAEARRVAGKMPTDTRTTIPVDNVIKKALEFLDSYLVEFPEHDQGDLRIWEAAELLRSIGD